MLLKRTRRNVRLRTVKAFARLMGVPIAVDAEFFVPSLARPREPVDLGIALTRGGWARALAERRYQFPPGEEERLRAELGLPSPSGEAYLPPR